MIYIRLRHLLCLIGFNGKWHNKESIKKFRVIREKIQEHNQELGTLITATDSICSACIHHKSDKCCRFETANEYFEEKDKRVAAKTGIEIGKQYRLRYAIEQVLSQLDTDDVHEICSQCAFYKKQCLCYQIIKKEQYKNL